MKVAVPWSLSHYIPLNSFNPIYRGLFDFAPSDIDFSIWDNTKLSKLLESDANMRRIVVKNSNNFKKELAGIKGSYLDFFWPPNQFLTGALPGDIEFHHTAPFPSMLRPFVLHCESFINIFCPFECAMITAPSSLPRIRDHYKKIFSHPLCLGIFSHIPETIESIAKYFQTEAITKKLFLSGMGLSEKILADTKDLAKPYLAKPNFLFINSDNQNQNSFFNCGGHIVLSFFEKYLQAGYDGLLIMRCTRPSNEKLREFNVNLDFINYQFSRKIIWVERYVSEHEQNILIAKSNFLLIPSQSLQSSLIMQAMHSNTIPVVTDTVGTSVYVDASMAIILNGVRESLWKKNFELGLELDSGCISPQLNNELIKQLTTAIFDLLANKSKLKIIQRNLKTQSKKFLGSSFSQDFWAKIQELHCNYHKSKKTNSYKNNSFCMQLQTCLLDKNDYTRVFAGPTQPINKVYTGSHKIFELGDSYILCKTQSVKTSIHAFSPVAAFYAKGFNKLCFAKNIHDLPDDYISGFDYHEIQVPESTTSERAQIFLGRYFRYLLFLLNTIDLDNELHIIKENFFGYNIVRLFHKYYAIPCTEGDFDYNRLKQKKYTNIISGYSYQRLKSKLNSCIENKSD